MSNSLIKFHFSIKTLKPQYLNFCTFFYFHTDDRQDLTSRATKCLSACQHTDQVIPRQEIIEHCAVYLLNVGEWDLLSSLEKQPVGGFEFIAALSDAANYKGNSKFPKEAWEIMLNACKPNREQSQKRSNSNTGSTSSNAFKDTLAGISAIFNKLRDQTVLNVAISLLARLYNISRDDSSLELYTAFLSLWPSTFTKWGAFFNLGFKLWLIRSGFVNTYIPHLDSNFI